MSIYPSTCGGVPSWYGTAGPSSPAQTWLYRGLWSAGTAYAAGDLVVVCTEGGTPSNGTIYQATTTHCGDESAQPGSGPDWRQFWRVYAEPGTPTPLPPLCPDDGVTLPPGEGLAEHAAGTTDVHGIPDTSELVTRSEMEQAIAAALANLPPAEGDWETPEGAQAKADAVLAEAVAAASLDAETRDQEVLQRAQAAAEEARTAAVTAAAADADQKDELILQQAQEAAEEARTAAVAAGEEAAREAEQNAAATAATHAEAQDALVLQQAQEAALAAQEAAESAAADDATQKAQAALQEALTASEACCEESRAYARTLLEQHEQERHTPMTFTDGIVAEEGWEVDAQKLVVVDNELTAIVRLSRTGPDLVTLEDPQEGNLVPDILIARCSEEWCPPDTVYIIGATGYGHGSLRIHATGEVYLLDWSDNNPLKTDHDLRWTYTVLKETPSGS